MQTNPTIFVNTYECITKPKVLNTIDVNDWFSQIQNPPTELRKLIELARSYNRDSEAYKQIKNSLPTTTYNFTYNKTKKDVAAVDSTGLLFIETDDSSFDIKSLNTELVFAYYKSLSTIGYHIVVKVENLTINNFKEFYHQVLVELNMIKYCDKNCIKKSQYSIISYDKDIFINHNSKIFSFNTLNNDIINFNKTTLNLIKGFKEEYIVKKESIFDGKFKIIFSNIDEIRSTIDWSKLNDVASDFDNGWEFIECISPSLKKCSIGMRNSSLLAFTNNLFVLNSNVPYGILIKIIHIVNGGFSIPLTYNEVETIGQSVLKYVRNKTIKPIYRKKNRKIIFSKDCNLDKDGKLAICRELLVENKIKNTNEKLNTIINDWNIITDGKLIQSKICKMYGMSSKTLVKYWGQYETKINEINENFKQYKKQYKD